MDTRAILTIQYATACVVAQRCMSTTSDAARQLYAADGMRCLIIMAYTMGYITKGDS